MVVRGPYRGAATPRPAVGEFDAGLGGWTLDGEPYTPAPGSRFDWFRTRMLGGRTNHWRRISLRFGPDDFRRRSLDGLGDDWPITYDDLKPYYDEVDRLVGLFGYTRPHNGRKACHYCGQCAAAAPSTPTSHRLRSSCRRHWPPGGSRWSRAPWRAR